MNNNISTVISVAIGGGLVLLMVVIGSLIIDSQVAILQEQYPELSAEVCRAAVIGQLSKSKVLAHPDWQWEVILKKNVRNGMTKEEVMESWGRPNHTYIQFGREHWIYHNTILHFSAADKVFGWASISRVSYDDLFRNNERYVGRTVSYEGRIIQVMGSESTGFVWRVATGYHNTLSKYYDDVILVLYDGPRFLEDDIVNIWGEVEGLATYEAVYGQDITIPKLQAVCVKLVKK